MKIFVSWSGPHSLGVATALREWLPYIFNDIQLFVSSEDIRKGKRWPLEISKQLNDCNFGIVCLTPDNLEAPWLLFESGALSKSVQEASVYTLLLGGLRFGDIDGPLSHFQHTAFEKDDFYKLVKCINDAHAQGKHDEVRLKKIFDKFWDELETNVDKALKSSVKPEKKKSTDEMLNQLLETTNYIARNIRPEKATLDDLVKAEYLKSPSILARRGDEGENVWLMIYSYIRDHFGPDGQWLTDHIEPKIKGKAIQLWFRHENKERASHLIKHYNLMKHVGEEMSKYHESRPYALAVMFYPRTAPKPKPAINLFEDEDESSS